VITVKTGISKKEKTKIAGLLTEFIDLYGDFYITKNNLRLYIKENLQIFFNGLKRGNYIAYDNIGIASIVGYADKASRKYIKILANNEKSADKLIKALLWNIPKIPLFAKIKKDSPFKNALYRNGFQFRGGRGKELLLVREINKENRYDRKNKDKT